MSKIDFLKEQIIESRNFVNRLVSEIPENQWYTIPEGTDSNFAWQIGHLTFMPLPASPGGMKPSANLFRWSIT